MATFPPLKTGAVAQYPAARTYQYQNQIVRFVDGHEQRYRDSAGLLRQWTIRLDFLDATELAAIDDFFLANQGSFAEFAFTDPWDSVSYPRCSIAGDYLVTVADWECRNLTSITIVENRVSL
jgi:phage-related protein